MKYYIHAYADEERRLSDKEDIIEAENDDEAHNKALGIYAEYEEIYVERASAELLQEYEARLKEIKEQKK